MEVDEIKESINLNKDIKRLLLEEINKTEDNIRKSLILDKLKKNR